jgi:chaperonin cofactor prefoldin
MTEMSKDEALAAPTRAELVQRFLDCDGLGAQFVEGPVYAAVAQQLQAQAAEVESLKRDMAHVLRERDETFQRMLARAEAAEAEVERLRNDCGEAYQVIGYGMLGEPGPYTQADVERALDNLSAAVAGDPRPHDDLLPFPKFDALLDPATVSAEGGGP